MTQKLNFEASMKRLTEIVELLEKNESDLDASIALFEEGLKLVQNCDSQLKGFEDKVAQLMSQFTKEE